MNSGPNGKGIKQIEEWLKTTVCVCVFVCLGGRGGSVSVSLVAAALSEITQLRELLNFLMLRLHGNTTGSPAPSRLAP